MLPAEPVHHAERMRCAKRAERMRCAKRATLDLCFASWTLLLFFCSYDYSGYGQSSGKVSNFSLLLDLHGFE